MFAPTVTSGIAGYMAKYLGKHLANPTNEARRAYNCSRNIKKVRSHGTNIYDIEKDVGIEFISVPNEIAQRKTEYTVPFLGACSYTRYQVI